MNLRLRMWRWKGCRCWGKGCTVGVGLPEAAPAATTLAPLRSQGLGGETCDIERRGLMERKEGYRYGVGEELSLCRESFGSVVFGGWGSQELLLGVAKESKIRLLSTCRPRLVSNPPH